MGRSYSTEEGSVTDQEVARYEVQVRESLDVAITLQDGLYSAIDIQGDVPGVYEEDNQLAKGVALGNYLFEELTEHHWNDEHYARPIFTEMDTPPVEVAESMLENTSEEFRHGFVNNRKISDDLGLYSIQDSEGISPSREKLYESVTNPLEENDLTAAEIVDKIQDGEIEIDVDSAQYKSWVSTALNEFADRGLIGRYDEGRTVKYTAEPEKGFRGQVIKSDFDLEQKNNFLDRNRPVKDTEFEEMIGSGRQPREIMLEFAGRASWEALNNQSS